MTLERHVATQQALSFPAVLVAALDLFLVSLLLLVLELACIRWFAAHVLFLTFFTNIILLASFLGMSIGCLLATRRRDYLRWTAPCLACALAAPHITLYLQKHLRIGVDADQSSDSTQLILFGTEFPRLQMAWFVVPIEFVAGAFFLVIAVVFLGLGQELGRALNRLPWRRTAYGINILGGIAGVAIFAMCSWLELSPFWWFLPAAAGLAYWQSLGPLGRPSFLRALLLGLNVFVVLRLADGTSTSEHPQSTVTGQYVTPILNRLLPGIGPIRGETETYTQCFWSPYYRIDYEPLSREVYVNLIIHQRMLSRDTPYPGYSLPHALWRHASGVEFSDVLVIGAGTGNDVSRALQWGAQHVDAVEIDPVILRLGQELHPDRPYRDVRVCAHLGDGRRFLRQCERQYDLIVYGLVDSLILHSGHSGIRLESYLFTREGLAEARRCLKEGGLLVMYNNYRQGWLVSRLHRQLTDAFGKEPVIITIPGRDTIRSTDTANGFTILFAGNTDGLRDSFLRHRGYWLRTNEPLGPASPNGFTDGIGVRGAGGCERLGLTHVMPVGDGILCTTDDWPFLYLREPRVPGMILRGGVIIVVLSLLLLGLFLGDKQKGSRWRGMVPMFFLGVGFMLLEAKSIVLFALLFGSTWAVSAIVVFAVLVTMLAANIFVAAAQPVRILPYYVGVVGTLLLSIAVPVGWYVRLCSVHQVFVCWVLVFGPVWFGSVLFVLWLGRVQSAYRALGVNVAGCVVGGLLEYSSMVVGYRYVGIIALVVYVLSVFQVNGRDATGCRCSGSEI